MRQASSFLTGIARVPLVAYFQDVLILHDSTDLGEFERRAVAGDE
jgi:hypothetical protein